MGAFGRSSGKRVVKRGVFGERDWLGSRPDAPTSVLTLVGVSSHESFCSLYRITGHSICPQMRVLTLMTIEVLYLYTHASRMLMCVEEEALFLQGSWWLSGLAKE